MKDYDKLRELSWELWTDKAISRQQTKITLTSKFGEMHRTGEISREAFMSLLDCMGECDEAEDVYTAESEAYLEGAHKEA